MIKKIVIITFIIILTMIFANNTLYKKALAISIEEFDQYYSVYFPAGSYFSIVLEEPLDTGVNHEEDTFNAIIDTNLYAGNLIIIPRGSRVLGKITYIERAHIGRNSTINIRFISITPSNSKLSISINALIKDKNSDGSIGGTLTEKTELKKIVHNIEGIGAIDQVVPTGPRAMGNEIYIPAGERWIIQLIDPVTITVPK